MIGPTTSIAARPHRVRVQQTTSIPDGDGGYTDTLVDADPPYLYVQIRPATAQDLERSQAGTVIAMGSVVISGPFHPQISTLTQLTCVEGGRTHVFQVLGCSSPDLRGQELTMLASEVVQ